MLQAVWGAMNDIGLGTIFGTAGAIAATTFGIVSVVRGSNNRKKINELSEEVETLKGVNNEIKEEFRKEINKRIDKVEKLIDEDSVITNRKHRSNSLPNKINSGMPALLPELEGEEESLGSVSLYI